MKEILILIAVENSVVFDIHKMFLIQTIISSEEKQKYFNKLMLLQSSIITQAILLK